MKRLVVIAPLVLLLTSCGQKTIPTTKVETVSPVEVVVEKYESEVVYTVPPELAESLEPAVVEESEPEVVVYRVTAYCPCEICCGKWAKNRPVDENGEQIVIGAGGVRLLDGYSVASPMAFGTLVELDGIGIVEVQDRTANWVVDKYGENIIDIYMTNHEDAKQFGLQYIEGVIK